MSDPRGPWSRLRRASGGFRHGLAPPPRPPVARARPWLRRLRHAAIWLALALALAIGYSYRAELGDVVDRLRGELVPYAAVTTEDGALRVRAQPDGHFYVDTLVDGQEIRFLVDTGASTVSLSRDDAVRLGHDLGRLDFSRRIQTAGGVVRGAPVLLRRLELGETGFTDVRAIVNEQPMPISLLGVNALDRFESYEVRDGILTLRPQRPVSEIRIQLDRYVPCPISLKHAVMAGLVPAIHGFFVQQKQRTWMPGTSPGMTEG